MRIEFSAGQLVRSAAEALVKAAREHGTASGSFNDIEMAADGSMDADAIVAKWLRDMDARSVAYRNSPEGMAAAAMREAEMVRLQAKADMSTDPDWCRENPREAASEIDRLRKRVEELEQIAAGWRDIANAKAFPEAMGSGPCKAVNTRSNRDADENDGDGSCR